MRHKLLFHLKYFAFWLLFFFIGRLIFLLFHIEQVSELSLLTLVQIPFHGFKLDASFSAYLSAIPFLLLAFSSFGLGKWLEGCIRYFTFSMVFILGLMMFVDIGLYGHWETRLDTTFLMYTNTPIEMLASIPVGSLAVGSIVWLFFSFGMSKFFAKFLFRSKSPLSDQKWWFFFPSIIIFLALIIPMRGGIQTIPINQSNVYFSSDMFANHAAVNYAWNFMKSWTDGNHETKNHFQTMTRSKAQNIIQKSIFLMDKEYKDSLSIKALNMDRPNVIFIVWESLTAKVVASLDGVEGVTPHLEEVIRDGILFDRFYANGSRSDKGLVALMSGYYPQPDKSIMKTPSKNRSLPMLPQILKDNGYSTSFYYGGNMNFGNMNSYFRNGIDHIVDGNEFKRSDWNSKWGAHDHILFDRYFRDVKGIQKEPFLDVIFTLSSHEPFEFPGEYKFGKSTEEGKFKSALAYTDSTIGDFIKKAKQEPWWNNTLVIITADHGHPLPKIKVPSNSPMRFQVPMIWTGGALSIRDTTISSLSSQVDVAYTLLEQMQIDNSVFEWSQNFLDKSDNHFAQYIFTKGFGIIDKDGELVYDYDGKKVTHSNTKNEQSRARLEELGRAITQVAYQDFLDKGH